MKLTDPTTERLWKIAEPVCTGAGYELVDLMLTQTRGGWVLRVFIDYPPHEAGQGAGPSDAQGEGSRIGFTDCERVSHELSAVLDVEDPIHHAYSLEVSSPGLDRPLRTVEHFERFIGQDIKVTMHQGLGGRRNFKGKLVTLSRGREALAPGHDSTPTDADEVMITMNVDGTEYRLPFNDIESARLVPDWNMLFQRGQQR